MAEIKISDQIVSEFASLETAGNGLNSSYLIIDKSEISSLPAAMKFAEVEKKISDLLILYNDLLKKDSNDMRQVVETMKVTDEKAATSY